MILATHQNEYKNLAMTTKMETLFTRKLINKHHQMA